MNIIKSLVTNIEDDTINNTFYRKVIHTGKYSQLVLMKLDSNTEIGYEVHPDNDQFIRIEKGECIAILNEESHIIKEGFSISVTAGTYHNIINNGYKQLKLYTIYSPPLHDEDELIP